MNIYIVWYKSIDPQEIKPLHAIGVVIHGAYKNKLTAIKTACVEQVSSLLYDEDEYENIIENSRMVDWLDEHPFPSVDSDSTDWVKYFRLLSDLVYYNSHTIIGNKCYCAYSIDTNKLV